jgi:small nuclear ribonucleoprotein (snRNP)-like protein
MEASHLDMADPVASSSTAATAPTDPFQLLAQHIQRRVAITLLPLDPEDPQDGGVVVSGTLLSVDDLCNVLLSSWISTDAVDSSSGVATGHGKGSQDGATQQPRKKTRTEANVEVGDSLRLIRGAQIASISLLA